MSNPTRPTNVEQDQAQLINTYSHYLTRGVAKMIRNMDFNLFTLKTDPNVYITTITKFAYEINGFAQAYKEWCRNFRHRKDLYWIYEVEPEFDNYQYLGKTIIKELEFSYLYYNKKGRGKNVKGFQYVLQEFIDNRKENYDILKEYLHWLENGNNDEILFQKHVNFQINEQESRGFLTNIACWIRQALQTCDENRKVTYLLIDTRNLKPWTPFQNK
jgi:hypothetical protein